MSFVNHHYGRWFRKQKAHIIGLLDGLRSSTKEVKLYKGLSFGHNRDVFDTKELLIMGQTDKQNS